MMQRIINFIKRYKISFMFKVVFSISLIMFICMYIFINITLFNGSMSSPIGFYMKTFRPVQVRDYIQFPIDKKYYDITNTPNDNKKHYFIKHVVAAKGDHIILKGKRVIINDRIVAFRYELQGIDNIEIDKILEDGEYFVLSKNPYSFDSRYYGIVKEKDIVSGYRYIPIISKDIDKINKKVFGENYWRGE